MKASLFKEMMAGFDEAVKHRRGQKARSSEATNPEPQVSKFQNRSFNVVGIRPQTVSPSATDRAGR